VTISIAKWSRKAVVLTRVYRIQMSKTMSFEDAEGTVLIEDARTLPFKCPAVAQVSYEHPDVSNLNDIFADSTTNCQIPRLIVRFHDIHPAGDLVKLMTGGKSVSVRNAGKVN
jgi:hypothetical protein